MAMNAMVQAYHSQGWQVYLLSMNTTRHYISPQVLATLYKDIYAFDTVEVDNDLKPLLTIKNYLFSSLPNHAERFYNKGFEQRLINTLRDFNPHVIQVESVFLSEYLPVIKANSEALTLLRLHNIEWQIWNRLAAETTNIAKRLYLSNLAKRIKEYEVKVWSMYDLLLPITTYDAAIISESINPAKIFTVPFGVQHTDKPAVEEEWVGYHIGAMDWLPNAEAIEWFLKAVWPVVHQQTPGFKFFFAGRNMPAKYKYMDVDGISCMGEVADADAFIANKKILIVPLRSGGGVRIKILEAMSAGKLVISTSIGMQGIDAEAGKHFLLADDAETFAAQISWALSHPREAELMIANTRQLMLNKYDANTIAASLSSRVLNLL